MEDRDVHELAADIMESLADALDAPDRSSMRLRAGALRNEAMHIHAGCDAPDWALDLAETRLHYGELAA